MNDKVREAFINMDILWQLGTASTDDGKRMLRARAFLAALSKEQLIEMLIGASAKIPPLGDVHIYGHHVHN